VVFAVVDLFYFYPILLQIFL